MKGRKSVPGSSVSEEEEKVVSAFTEFSSIPGKRKWIGMLLKPLSNCKKKKKIKKKKWSKETVLQDASGRQYNVLVPRIQKFSLELKKFPNDI